MDGNAALLLQLLEWVAAHDRTYEEAMSAWRTSCPRYPIWEDATDGGLVSVDLVDGKSLVRLTPAGLDHLRRVGNTRPSSGV